LFSSFARSGRHETFSQHHSARQPVKLEDAQRIANQVGAKVRKALPLISQMNEGNERCSVQVVVDVDLSQGGVVGSRCSVHSTLPKEPR
jgi:hypothetical protein